MAKTNWQDPKTSEMRSTHVAGLMEAVGKIEDSIGMESVFETNIPLTEVFISSDDRYRIFQAPEGKRNWTAEQPPVIKRNGSIITSGFEIDYGGGAIILNVNDTVENTYTADVTYIKTSKVRKLVRFVIGTSTSGWTEKDCDYLCDGTNDQEEIIQALNALPATGGEVVILDGTYNITASINIPKDNVSIRGSGNATTLKRMYNSTSTDSGSTAWGLITLNGKSGCKIQGLQIDGNKATYKSSYNSGIYLTSSSSDNTVIGNTCNNNNSYGIYLTSSSSNNTVTGNTCNNNSYGIRLSSSSNNTVTNNTCNNNSDYGIYLSSSSNNTVTSNTCNNNTTNGIRLYSSSSDNTVTSNTCNNNSSTGIYLSSSSNNTVTGNTCKNNNSYGIYLFSYSNNNTVTGNTCNNNNTSGIYLYSSSDNTVTGNTCIRGTGLATDYTASQHTIQLKGTDNSYNLISNNNCMGKAPVVEGGTGNTLVNNKWNATSDFEDLRTDVGDKANLTTVNKTNLVSAINEHGEQINTLDAEVAAHMAETVTHAEVTNKTITVGVGKDFATIQEAVDSLKKRIDSTIVIQLDIGEYSEEVKFYGFVGSGTVTLKGSNDKIGAANYKVKSIVIRQNSMAVLVEGLELINTGIPITIIANQHVIINNCLFQSIGPHALYATNAGTTKVTNCTMSNKTASAMQAEYISTLFSENNDGVNNNRVLSAIRGGTIIKNGTQPTGTTAEYTATGGLIR
jgi:parallel beta-helix repeat protein